MLPIEFTPGYFLVVALSLVLLLICLLILLISTLSMPLIKRLNSVCKYAFTYMKSVMRIRSENAMNPQTLFRLKIAYTAVVVGLLSAYMMLPLLSDDIRGFGERAVLLGGLVLMLLPLSLRNQAQEEQGDAAGDRAEDERQRHSLHPGMTRHRNPGNQDSKADKPAESAG